MFLILKSFVFTWIFLIIPVHCETSNNTTEDTEDNIDQLIIHDPGDDYVYLVMGGYRPKNHLLAKHIVSVRGGRPKKFFGDNHICGGIIISENVVLTAAHCVIDPKGKKHFSEFIVAAGSPFLFETVPTLRSYRIQKEVVHPIFSYSSMRGDVALLVLEKNFDIDGRSIQSVQLADTKPTPDMQCVAFGWGRIFPNGPRPDELLYVNLTLRRRLKCAELYEMNPSVICASDKNDYEKSVWKGDSGGPLICGEKLYGVVSFGYTSGGPSYFASVHEHRKWILENNASKLCFRFIVVLSIMLFVLQTYFYGY